MKHSEAKKLRDAWGEKPCDHKQIDKEYYLGADTMDFVCIICGQEFTLKEKQEIEEKRKNN
jgi:hypothetical protein